MATLKDKLYEKLSYTSQDYNSILQELIEVFNGSTNLETNWDNVSEADIMFIVMSLMAAHKDILNYMLDYRILESFMSTARERSSLVRIANSFGYKVPSYKAAKANFLFSNALGSGSETFTLPSFTQFTDQSNVPWVYVGNDIQITKNATSVLLYQGTGSSVTINPLNINRENMTHIFSSLNIAIGNNANNLGVSRLVVQKENNIEVWQEVENLYTYSGADPRVYEFNVDAQGITYIKFLETINLNDYRDFTFTIFFVNTQGDTVKSINGQINGFITGDVELFMTLQTIPESTFVEGSSPLKISEIREDFKRYYAGINSLVTLNDYKNFVLNRQKAVLGITKCLVIDGQGDTLNGSGNAAFTGTNVGIYALKADNTLKAYNIPLTTGERNALLEEVAKYKITGIITTIDGITGAVTGDNIAGLALTITFSSLPSDNTTLTNFKQFLIDYVSAKGIGEGVTTSEIYTLILNSVYAPTFTSGINIALTNNAPAYNQYLTLAAEDITITT
jgi:hypothetical protein